MRRLSRRRLLALGGTGLVGALSGCSDGSEPATEPADDGGGSGGTETPTPTPTATTEPGPEIEHPGFADRTGRVANGIVWHATEWGRTMSQVRVRANRVLGQVESLRSADPITENGIAALETAATEMADFLREAVVPHYEIPDESVLNGNNVLIQQLKVASRRGDREGQRTQLRRIELLYRKYAQRSFLETAFRNGPIHAKLLDAVAANAGALFGAFHPASGFVELVTADKAPDSPDDGVPQHVHEFPSGHIVVAHAHSSDTGHNIGNHANEPTTRQLYAYRNGQFDILQDTNAEVPDVSLFEPHLIDVFGSVNVPDRREDVVYVSVNDPVADFLALPLQIQLFDSVGTAAETVEFLLSADVFQEGTATVGGREWRRIYYTQQGTNIYAFLLQTGSYLVTVFPEPVPWEERVDWPGPFANAWITGGGGSGGDG
ncbi:MAG: hypothetical protein ABEH40_09820 [Haloferacaceae archaeon]